MLKGIIRQIIQTALAVTVTLSAANWAVRYAYENRGYEAAGGEYLLIPVVYISIYAGSSRLLGIMEEIHCHRNKKKQPLQADHDNKGGTGTC